MFERRSAVRLRTSLLARSREERSRDDFGATPSELSTRASGESSAGLIRVPPALPLFIAVAKVLSMTSEMIERALERRLRQRVMRADSEVEINPETIERWIREELEAIFGELAMAREIEQAARVLN